MGDATPLSLPADVPFPVTITRLLVSAGQEVRRGDPLLEYSFLSASRRKENAALEKEGKPVPSIRWKDDMVGSWEAAFPGTVAGWERGVKPGLLVDRRQSSKPLLSIEQPCTHPVQIHGMCGVCGADITNDDYLSRPTQTDNRTSSSKPADSFELAHDALGVTVSTNEARRLETQSRDQLLKSRRLSLIVDLDQTIIHTTVDPTVGEWLAEIEEDDKEADEEKSRQEGGSKTEDVSMADPSTVDGVEGRSTTPPLSPPRKREKNPNAAALRDVAAFRLADDLPPGYKGRPRQAPCRWYYTKPRPGLNDFLENMSQLYEMHVYTMGTRTYADEICKIIDPDGKYFGGRILSRDESGSMSSKSLVRLFPTDQSMVVIIDDRSDVWGDSPNLLKVVPYDFFLGIGDINGSFLPPTKPAVTAMPNQPPSSTSSSAASSPPPETPHEIPSQEEGMLLQSKLLDELAERRPLAKLEEESEHEGDEDDGFVDKDKEAELASTADGKPEVDGTNGEEVVSAKGVGAAKNTEDANKAKPKETPPTVTINNAALHHHHHHHHHRKQLLNPVDRELDRISNILTEVHTMYYKAYDGRDRESSTMPLQCDAPLLLQEIKDEVLAGCIIAFTGVIPRAVKAEDHEIWQQAENFGAVCVHDLNDKVTHLVTATQGTEKMHKAARMAATTGMHIVWLAWLQTSIALWAHEPEERFLVHPQPATAIDMAPSRPESIADANGDVATDAPPVDDDSESAESVEDAAAMAAAWDDDADAELEEFLNASDSDSENEDEEREKEKDGKEDVEGENPDDDDDRDDDSSSSDELEEERAKRLRSRAGTPSTWSRAATPGPSILSRPGSPRPGSPDRHVRYADEENLPLESVREPQPGDIPSYPPRKRPRLLVAPTDDDDVPEANKMVYSGKPAWQGGVTENNEPAPASQESATSAMTEDEDEDEARLVGKMQTLHVGAGVANSASANADAGVQESARPAGPALVVPIPVPASRKPVSPSPLSIVTTASDDDTH